MKRSGKFSVSIIVTVFNESGNVQNLVSTLTNQTLKPSEIIIVDGGSTDDTWKILQRDKTVKSFQLVGNRSVGRNLAISKTKSPIIAITDAGCIPDPTWLEELVKPFSNPQTQIVSGYYRGLADNIFQKCLIPYVLVMSDKAGKTEFFPSTRSMAIRKSVWLGYKFPENLWHNEDYAYAHTLKNAGYKFDFAPLAIVNWIPRKDLKSAAWMFMRFAIGDIQAGIFRPQVKRLAVRYLVFLYLTFIHPIFLVLMIPYLIWAIIKNYRYIKNPRAIFWLPVLQLTVDGCVLFGSLIGFLSRIYAV